MADKKVYLVAGSAGSWDEYHTWNVAVFEDEHQAKWWKEQCQAVSDAATQDPSWYDKVMDRVNGLVDEIQSQPEGRKKPSAYSKVRAEAEEEVGREFNPYDPAMISESLSTGSADYHVEETVLNPGVPK